MSIDIPELDTINYQKLREEAEARLPKDAPQWSDHNLSDPGITFLELFAWLSDVELYRLNRITPEHLKKFLALLGDAYPTAKAAKGIIVSTKSIDETVRINRGTIIEIDSKNKKKFFRTSTTLYGNPAQIESINVLGSSEEETIRNVVNKSIEPFYAFGFLPKSNNYFRLKLNRMPSKRLKLYIELEESDLPTYNKDWEKDSLWLKQHDSIILEWYIKIGNQHYSIAPQEDCTLNLRYSGMISFILSEAITEVSTVSIECRLKQGAYMIAPFIKNIYLNTIEVEQSKKIIEKQISTGEASQELILTTPYILDNDIQTISIQTKKTQEKALSWRRVDSLHHSNEEDRDFVYDNTTQTITFGDGEHGKVPPYNEPIILNYYLTKGEQGNVPHRIDRWKIQDLSFYNPRSIEGGKNIPNYQERFTSIAESWKKPSQAVTLKDYETLAKMTTGLRVARAKALADKENNLVSVVVVPYSRSNYAMPDDFFCQRVCRFLDSRRLITTRIKVIKPSYTKVGINLEVKTLVNFDEETIRLSIITALNEYLHPLKGGDNKEGWEFGRSVYFSDIYALIESITGISCLFNLSFFGEGDYDHRKKVYLIQKDSLIETLSHKISFIENHLTCGGLE